jgi:hypothetical protein
MIASTSARAAGARAGASRPTVAAHASASRRLAGLALLGAGAAALLNNNKPAQAVSDSLFFFRASPPNPAPIQRPIDAPLRHFEPLLAACRSTLGQGTSLVFARRKRRRPHVVGVVGVVGGRERRPPNDLSPRSSLFTTPSITTNRPS